MFETLEASQLVDVQGGNAFHAGKRFGFDAGVLVTKALKHVSGWNEQVPGAPAGFEKRHESVAGPKISAFADKLMPGPIKRFFTGAGYGATAAPRWTYHQGE